MPSHSPTTDHNLERRYSSGSLEQKIHNKTSLQEQIGWPKEPRRPLVCLPAGMSEVLGGDLFKELLPGIFSLPVELLVLGKGSAEFGSLFTKLAKDHSHRVHIVQNSEAGMHKMMAAADMGLFLANGSTKDIAQCLAFGVVPIAPMQEGLSDYDPVQETGNAFTFENPTVWHVYASLVRACETYKFPFDWRTIQKHCMETVR